MLPTLNLMLCLPALLVALMLRPWRGQGGPALPWPALACWAVLPLLWSLDAVTGSPLLQPLSGIGLLLLMLGWPLTVLAIVPVALLMVGLGVMEAAEALHRAVWLGLVPATLAMALGAALRHGLQKHLFVYILGRGFFATALAIGASGALAALLAGVPRELSLPDVVLARGLAAFGDAFITGMLVAVFVAFRPHWLATYADRIYLPRS